MVPIVGTWFNTNMMSFYESINLHAKSTAQHWWESTQRQKRQIPTMMSLPQSWPLNRDGSCRRHLIQCKIMGIDESTVLRASQIDRTAPRVTGTAAKAANTCHEIAAEILGADSQWLLPPPPVSSNVATKKIRRSENYHFSSASAPNLPTARNHVEVSLHESGADAL